MPLIIFETVAGESVGLNPEYIKSTLPLTNPKETLVEHFCDRMTLCETAVKGTFKETNMKILRSESQKVN